ncbi:hypothetical protein ABIB37_002074 [Agrococcus sp. UYP10]|uniref:AbiTii domain-containing protein n=1 Tax=Agrococcus sp. UYP10 TaxID=1756355 RepID=UPI003394402A
MSLLDDIIDGATDDSVSTSNLLRKVQVVAHRLGADDILKWVQRELNGYPDPEDLPPYRRVTVNVMGTWAGPMQSRLRQPLSPGQMPEDAASVLFSVSLGASLAEMEELASDASEQELGVPWDTTHVIAYNQWVEEGVVPFIEHYGLFSANRIVTRGVLRGVIDAARNTALGFALDLQATAPEAGTSGGPTMAEAPVAQVVNNYYSTHIDGDGNQVAQGENIRQRSKVVKGDLSALLKAAEEVGLDAEGNAELARVVLADATERPSKIRSFLSRVREGAFQIGTGVTAEVAATQLSELIAAFQG